MLTRMLLFKSTGHRISLLCNVSRNVRLFASTPSEIPKKDETIFEIPKKDQSASASLGGGGMNRNTHKVDNLERKMLVRNLELISRLLSTIKL